MFILTALVAGLFRRWSLVALGAALIAGMVLDVLLLGPAAILTIPVFDGPIGLAAFLAASALASATNFARRARP